MKKVLFSVLVALMTLLRPIFPAWNIAYDRLPVSFCIESVSDIYTPAETEGANVCEYPTIIQLHCQKNAADNGKLLATFEKWGSTYPVYESTDDGETWQFLGSVKDRFNEGYWNEWMPFLYELPADMGSFGRGTIILAATSIYGKGVTDSTITLYASGDLGRTFTAFCNVDKAGGTVNSSRGILCAWKKAPELADKVESGNLSLKELADAAGNAALAAKEDLLNAKKELGL